MQFRGVEIVVIRKARRRNLTLKVQPHQPLRVLTRLGTSDRLIRQFLEEKWDWIQKNQVELNRLPRPLIKTGMAGEVWHLLGEPVQVKDLVAPGKKLFVVTGRGQLQVHWPTQMSPQNEQHLLLALSAIRRSRRLFAENFFKERMQVWTQQMALAPRKMRLMRARTRWGSCSSKGTLNLNEHLIAAPDWVVDSVIVHELAHLKHLNHSNEFWDLVAAHFPDHKKADHWLKQNTHILE